MIETSNLYADASEYPTGAVVAHVKDCLEGVIWYPFY